MQKQCAQRWFSVLALAGFAKQLREELQVRKMSRAHLLKLMDTQHDRLKVLAQTSKFVADALKFHEALQEQKTQERFQMLAHAIKLRSKVKIKRQRAQVIAQCLSRWNVPARCFARFRKYLMVVRMLQRWWRETSKHLKEQRDCIFKRWQWLDMVKMGAGTSKKATLVLSRFSNLGVEGDPADTQLRNRFIEYELRNRRYEVLPRIYLWEHDFKAWFQVMRSHRIAKQEAKKKGENIAGIPAPLIRWPPMRPTFMPPGHLRSEEKGGECPSWCPGRKGDQQILQMAEQFRQNPAAWHVCPKIQKRGKDANGTVEDAEQAMSIFGPPPSTADLQQWGAEPGALPGVHACGISRVRHGGEPRAWASSLVAASSAHEVGFRPVSVFVNPSTFKL